VNLNNFVKVLIFPAIGKELPSENATGTPLLDHAGSLGTTLIQSVWMKIMNSKI
jgi:hypothetical protein